MSITLGRNSHGQSKVRLTRVLRTAQRHDLIDWNVDVRLVGDFAATHLTGDNSGLIATDTMKNTVYAFAGQMASEGGGSSGPESTGLEDCELFAERLARHFLEAYPQVSQCSVAILERAWRRIVVDGQAHEHAWVQGGSGQRTCGLVVRRTTDGELDVTIDAGIAGLVLFKSSGSAFSGFDRDGYTLLPETDEHIFSTVLDAWWQYDEAPADRAQSWNQVRDLAMTTFATHDSRSVQQMAFLIGQRVLEALPEVNKVELSLSNRHVLPVDLTPFGQQNRSEVFSTTEEPHGQIDVTVERD